MENTAHRAIAIVGVGAILPDAPNAAAFWDNVTRGRYSVSEVDARRWDPALYYDPDPAAPDKTYSKIGGWVRDYVWDPVKWHLAVPPRVVNAMDEAQKWAIACTRQALQDYGYPGRPLDPDRTAVILGNAMAGEKHYLTALRIYFPEYARELAATDSFAALAQPVRAQIERDLRDRIGKHLPEITEDSMPGELANCIAGRIANIFNFHGPNYVCDAACASALAALSSAVEGLVERDYDAVITGGIDRNMGASTFVKFCKIGALSASGTRPYAEGADGFVMGEGAAMFLLKRLADAERDGDKVYAVLRGMGASSDGKGKGITAPNPIGQKLAVERAWRSAGLSPATATYIEGHGTSTRVGDVVEVQSMAEVLGEFALPPRSIALGSVKSNLGHLKGAAGAAGLLKAALALHHKVLPPSIHCERPNPEIHFAQTPLYVNTELQPWALPAGAVRRAGLSAFGFGGTNFHAVLEEYIPHRLNGNGTRAVVVNVPKEKEGTVMEAKSANLNLAPLRGALVLGAESESALVERVRAIERQARAGEGLPPLSAPAERDLHAPERLAIDYADAPELAQKAASALKAFAGNQPALWKALRAQGVYRGRGPAPQLAFLYPGQGSQYVNMLSSLRGQPIIAGTLAEADRVMSPLLGKPLTDFIFVDRSDPEALARSEEALRQTAITQPAVLAVDLGLTRLLAAYGIHPSFTMGHSLGEYAALVAAGALPFADALEAVSARGREMTNFAVDDNGRMAAVFAPLADVERILATIDGYVVIANINSTHQAVIGGASKAVEAAMEIFQRSGFEVAALPVSHAFHTRIVAPASEPLRRVLQRMRLQAAKLPVVANTDGEFYPSGGDAVPRMLDILAEQVASPVQFVKGLRTLYASGARMFVEVGPKKALQGFAEDVLGDHGDVISIFTNHPKLGDIPAFNQALCCLYAAGLGRGVPEKAQQQIISASTASQAAPPRRATPVPPPAAFHATPPASGNGDHYAELGRVFAEVLERGWKLYRGGSGMTEDAPVTITGAALGLPGTEHVFDDGNVGRLLRGEQFIDLIPTRLRRAILDKHITRLVKNDGGGGSFEPITNVAEVIKLAGRAGAFDLEHEFGVNAERRAALDRVTELAIAVGLDALRDAGIPLVLRHKLTSKGTSLPDRWVLPDALRDDTGVIFASAFPGFDAFANEMARYYADHGRREQLASLQELRARCADTNGDSMLGLEIDRRIELLRDVLEREPYAFDRRYLFRVLAMGHSQFAEYIGARGPNTAINAACASTTQAVVLAEDWIRTQRCRRVIVVAADDITTDHLIDWMGAGFLASGAAATDETVEDAAIPFDRRRHGLIIGMGAAGLVVESAEAASERGIRPICEVLSAVTANSAFHGTRLDVQHISAVMEKLVTRAERTSGIERRQIAPRTVFVSHETYTPARGGSASAEIHSLRSVFGEDADKVVIANTKGFTGHAMGAGIEDVLAVKALETGIVPPVANFKEADPELGSLNLSKGGVYPVEYALRLGAGFGSQISMTLLRWTASNDGAHRSPSALGYAYRIVDAGAWKAWLAGLAGHSDAELEVVHRTLRVRDLPVRSARIDRSQPIATEHAPASPPRKTASAPVSAIHSPDTPAEVTTAPPVRAVAEPARQVLEAASASLASASEAFAAAAPTDSKPVIVAGTAADAADTVATRILALVAEKTGYPTDMLDLNLDLEADLGIDTVKQAEMFAAVREIYNIPRDDNRKLRDYPTLAHVIRFVYEKRPELAVSPADTAQDAAARSQVAAEEMPPPGTTPSSDSVKDRILALVAEKTGYPTDMLDLDLDLEADLGIDTVKQAEIFAAIREMYGIARDESRKLRDYSTLARVIGFVYEKRPDLSTANVPMPRPAPEAATRDVAPERAPTPTPKPLEVVAAPSSAPAPATSPNDSIAEKVLEIVAEKTGYPKDMLDLDLDLEADLGIDTVKQAEMFAAIRAAYSIPRDANLKLRDFPTLAHVIQFARDRSAMAAPVVDQQSSLKADAQPRPDVTEGQPARPPLPDLHAANSIPRRVPVPVLRPPVGICKPSGVALERGSRVVLMPDRRGVSTALVARLEQRGVEVLCLNEALNVDAMTTLLQTFMATGPVHGVFWLPALDDEGPWQELQPATWEEAVRVRIRLLYAAMRGLFTQISKPGTFLVTATRLGGQHGYDGKATAPLGGGVVGFAKTYKRERPKAHVKAVDFGADSSPSEIADSILQETLRDPGAVEIGHKHGLRWTVGLEEQPLPPTGSTAIALNRDTVFLVTGAAGGIVSAITCELAAASGGTFYLLDLVPEPAQHDPGLERLAADREGLKRDLFARMQARGERATPAMVEKELAALERAHAARQAIDAVRAAGGTAHYFSVDLVNAEAVARVVDVVRQRSGRIDVLLHAAGLDRSRSLADKEPGEFDLVFDVKVSGIFNLLRAVGGMPLETLVAFSSIAGRFGNPGQTDYSSANDLLCKLVSNLRRTRPSTRALAIDWTAWGGIGMATRGSIPKVMEMAGIDLLPPDAGVAVIRRELITPYAAGEIVIGQRLGVLLNEWDATGGLEPPAAAPQHAVALSGPMLGRAISAGVYHPLVVEATLDPRVQPFLHDHQIDATPVLPGVMGLEAFAESALALAPGWHVETIENVDFVAPFKFYRHEPRTVTVETQTHGEADRVIADCRLIGSRTLPNSTAPQYTTHFSGRVCLCKEPPRAVFAKPLGTLAGRTIEAGDIYRLYFHGPAYRVIERAWWDGDCIIGLMATGLPADHLPFDSPMALSPRVVELCFQTAGLWEMGIRGVLGLPQHIDHVSVLQYPDEGPCYAVVRPHPGIGSFDAEVVDVNGRVLLQMAGYRTAAVPNAIEPQRLQALRAVMTAEAVAA